MQVKLDMVKRRMGIEEGKPNPFDYTRAHTRRVVLNKEGPKYQQRFAKTNEGDAKKPIGSAGKNSEAIADIQDGRIIPQHGEKGYSYQRTELIRHSVSTAPQSFDFPNNTRPDDRIFYEREMRERARDVYAEVRAKSKAYREEKKKINRDVSEAVQQLDKDYNKIARLLPRETRLGSQAIVAEFQPLEGARARAARSATNLADAVRACAETLEKMDKEKQVTPSAHPKKAARMEAPNDDPEDLNGDFNLADTFSSDTYIDTSTDTRPDGSNSSEQDTVSDGEGEHKLPSFLQKEVQQTYFERLSFVLSVPETFDEFQTMLNSVQELEEILVLDRLIKSNSILLNGSNRPSMERLALFCTTRLTYLSYEAPELDPVRIDAQVRGLRHITTEIPDYMLILYQKMILRYNRMIQTVRFIGAIASHKSNIANNCLIKVTQLDSLGSIVLSIQYDTSSCNNDCSEDKGPKDFISTYGRVMLGGIILTNLMSIVFPQGTYYAASPDDLMVATMRVFEEQPLYSGLFLANDTPIQGLCMRLEQLLLSSDLAEMDNAEVCSLYRELLLLQLITTSTLTLANATQLYIPSISRALEVLLQAYSCLFAYFVTMIDTKKAQFQRIVASYMTVGISDECRIELLPALFQRTAKFSLGNVVASFSSVLNACFLQFSILAKCSLSSTLFNLETVGKKLHDQLVGKVTETDTQPQKFSIEWTLQTLLGILSSNNTTQKMAWIEERLPEIKANEPVYVMDFCPGKTLDPNKARERARIEKKRTERQKREELRQAQREVRRKAMIRSAQAYKLKVGRTGALHRVQHMLESDQHSYKDLDAAKARLSKKRAVPKKVNSR